MKRVFEISLICNNISGIEEKTFTLLHSLFVIRLGKNRLTALNVNIFNNQPRKPLLLELCGNRFNCRSLCWLKDEIEHKLIHITGGHTCAEVEN